MSGNMQSMKSWLRNAAEELLSFLYPGGKINPAARRRSGSGRANGMIRDFFSPAGQPPRKQRGGGTAKQWKEANEFYNKRVAETKKRFR